MNRSALNAAPLGSGNSLPWSTFVINQALQMVCSLTLTVRKVFRATQAMTLSPTLRLLKKTPLEINGAVALSSYAVLSSSRRVSCGPISQTLALSGSVGLHSRVPCGATQTLSLEGTATLRSVRHTYLSMTQALTLSPQLTLHDLSRNDAPDERTAYVPAGSRVACVEATANTAEV